MNVTWFSSHQMLRKVLVCSFYRKFIVYLLNLKINRPRRNPTNLRIQKEGINSNEMNTVYYSRLFKTISYSSLAYDIYSSNSHLFVGLQKKSKRFFRETFLKKACVTFLYTKTFLKKIGSHSLVFIGHWWGYLVVAEKTWVITISILAVSNFLFFSSFHENWCIKTTNVKIKNLF